MEPVQVEGIEELRELIGQELGRPPVAPFVINRTDWPVALFNNGSSSHFRGLELQGVIEEAGEPAVIVTLTDASWSSECRHMAHAARRS
jgi:hypothetical protein